MANSDSEWEFTWLSRAIIVFLKLDPADFYRKLLCIMGWKFSD